MSAGASARRRRSPGAEIYRRHHEFSPSRGASAVVFHFSSEEKVNEAEEEDEKDKAKWNEKVIAEEGHRADSLGLKLESNWLRYSTVGPEKEVRREGCSP